MEDRTAMNGSSRFYLNFDHSFHVCLRWQRQVIVNAALEENVRKRAVTVSSKNLKREISKLLIHWKSLLFIS